MRKFVIAGGVLLIASIATVIWIGSIFDFDRDRQNQERIAKLYITFYREQNRFAGSLAELVDKGYLPHQGPIFREPLGLFERMPTHQESTYVVCMPPDNNVDSLRMIGRSVKRNHQMTIEFDPMINAMVRDEIKESHKK